MPTATLTDAKCRAAKPGPKLRKLFDGGGLFLALLPSGAKVWRVAYRLDGAQKTKSLGPYPDVGLAEARRLLVELKAQLRAGVDPMAERAKPAAVPTLADASDAYWQGRRDLTDGYRCNAMRALEMYVTPTLGGRPINAITRDDVLGVLRPMDARGRHVYVRKTRMWLGQVFDQAIEHGHCMVNPCASINPKKAFGQSPVQHFPSLPLRDVPAFMQRLSLENPDLQSVLACRLLALTWVRTTELRMMRWSELDGDLWRIPADRMKRRRDHVVPLSTQAQALIARLRERATRSEYVFPADHRNDRPMSENAVLYLIHRIGYQDRMSGHGWRSVASTWANEHGYSPDAIERQLAHVPGDTVRAAYNHAEFLPQRRIMLQAWADWLTHQAGA